MNGVRYHRIRRGIPLEKLSVLTGISIPTIRKMETSNEPGTISALNYRKVADVLNVSPDELIRIDFPDDGDGYPKRVPYPSQTEKLSNCIAIYRRANMLTYQQLALRLGLATRERGRQICSTETPMAKHLEALAKYEDVSTIEFIQKYQ